MKLIQGLLINLQFFSIIPVRKEIDMNEKNLEGMLMTLPLFGLILGFFTLIFTFFLVFMTGLSPLAVTLILILTSLFVTGGIHLDGWMDTWDAYYSYQDQKKRLEVMQDPRVGAFAVIGLMVNFSLKFLFIYEVIQLINEKTFILILFIPFLTRLFTGLGLVMIPSAKQKGLAHLFQQGRSKKVMQAYLAYLIPMIIILGIYNLNFAFLFSSLVLLVMLTSLFYKRFILKNFNGLTGDLSGAGLEGMGLILWCIIWILHSYGIV